MKRSLTNQSPSPRSVFSSLLGFAGGNPRSLSGLGKLQLFGMSGTLGRGAVRHCDTWEFGEGNPEKAATRQEIQDIAQRRREEASERFNGEKKKGFYDFFVR